MWVTEKCFGSTTLVVSLSSVDIDGWPDHWSVATNLLVADGGKVWAERAVYGDDRQHLDGG